jgi:phosphatidylglycerophosphate synthase
MDRGLFVVTGALVALVGIVAAAFSMNLAHRWLSYAAIFAIALIALLLALALAVQKEWGILSGPARLAKRLRYCREWLEKREHLIVSIEEKLFSFRRDAPKAFWMSFGLNVLTHLAALSEIYVVLRLMGFNIGVVGALIFEALTKLVNVVGLLNPGNVGTYEGGNDLIARMFNLGADTGMVVAVARRIRAIFWASIGVVYLVVLTKHKKRCPSQDNMDSCGETGGPQPSPACQIDSQSAARARIAIVIAGTPQQVYDIRSPLTRIGTLPVILRTILGIQKAGATRVIVCGDSQNAPALRCELEATGRLPASVEWFEITPSTRNLGSILGRLALEAEPDPLLVVAGDTAYYPALLRDAIAWDGTTEALAFLSDSKPIGIWSLPSAVATRIAERCEDGARDSELYPQLTENAVEHRDVPKDRWQQVLTEADRGAAEEKLNRWLVKPTDGLFARFNRRISVPVSRQLIKWPITPNMVSLFTLAVGFVSGFFFACGGYWNTVFAAVLSVWASILDGCDGEVARLKLQESDFGCWLETICDYLYYLSIFSGMAIGLVRRSGPTYVVWTELLLAGAVMSFLVTGMGRRRIAGARPEQYLGIWQTQAESRRSNPILYIGRHTEFIIRRCFLPYALLAFALLNLTKVAFIMSAIGVNLVWLISLYSYRSFTATPASPAADSVGPA